MIGNSGRRLTVDSTWPCPPLPAVVNNKQTDDIRLFMALSDGGSAMVKFKKFIVWQERENSVRKVPLFLEIPKFPHNTD